MISCYPAGSELLRSVMSLLNFSVWGDSFSFLVWTLGPTPVVWACPPNTQTGLLSTCAEARAWKGGSGQLWVTFRFLSPSLFPASLHVWVTAGSLQQSRRQVAWETRPARSRRARCLRSGSSGRVAAGGHVRLRSNRRAPGWVWSLGRLQRAAAEPSSAHCPLFSPYPLLLPGL